MGAVLGLVLGLGVRAVGPAPTIDREAIEADRARCKSECAPIEASTDRSTCELVCDTRADNRLEGPVVESWKSEKLLGGPAPGVPVGYEQGQQRTVTRTVTHDGGGRHDTVTTTDPAVHGGAPTTTTASAPGTAKTQRTHAPAASAGLSVFASRVVLAGCQQRCDVVTNTTNRCLCKAQCLRKHPTPKAVLGRPAAGKSPATPTTGAIVAPSMGQPAKTPARPRGEG